MVRASKVTATYDGSAIGEIRKRSVRIGCASAAESAADDREHERFARKLGDEVGARCAERGAHGQFAPAIERPRRQQTGDVERRNQEHCQRDHEQDNTGAAELAAPVLAHRLDPRLQITVDPGMRPGEAAVERGQLVGRLRGGRAGRETANGVADP